MALLDDIKLGLGVFYSDINKEKDVQRMINGAIAYFKGGGWIIDPVAPSALAIDAIIVYCKMAQSTDPTLLINHPVLISYIAQSRAVVEDES